MAEPSADSVDRLITEWATAEPPLDVQVVGVVHRIRLLRAHFESALEANFKAHGLTGTGFGVLSALVRAGDPPRVSQRELVDLVHLTAGTVSLRIDQLESDGLVRRLPDPDDGRSTLVELTDEGRTVVDHVAPGHLALQERLLASLSESEQTQLVGLLRRLLAAFEPDATGRPLSEFGLEVSPAHESMTLQAQMGLSPQPGLLVRSVRPLSEADEKGFQTGDLIVGIGDLPGRSAIDLADAIGRNAPLVELQRGNTSITIQL